MRFVQLYCGGRAAEWDAHDDIEGNHTQDVRRETDKPIAALLKDLKRARAARLRRWSSGAANSAARRCREGADGRDHNPYGFTMWMAGGGVKRRHRRIGATDEIGLTPSSDRVHVHDLHATILHLLGLDHKQLTFLHNGRDERLTMNGGRVVHELVR